jgi:hypothetical protein
MKAALSSSEYTQKGGTICPYCQSEEIEGVSGVGMEAGEAWQTIRCLSCSKSWDDVYRLAGYEGTSEDGRSQDEEGKTQDCQTGIYLVFIENDIEPRIVGPFADGDERDRKAHELRRERGRDHGIFMLDMDPVSGVPMMDAYCGGFFMEEDEQ